MAVQFTAPALSSRAYADLWSEVSDVALEITGALPAELEGTLHRVVPTAFDWPHGSLQHWFDGHGQVHAIRLSDGRARYSNRFVRTAAFERAMKTKQAGSGFGTRAEGGLLRNLGGPNGTANTNVVKLGDRLYALQEGSRPQAMDPVTLETLGPDDLGFLSGHEGLSAHPHLDPARGEVVAANLVFGKEAIARVHTLDRTGRRLGGFDVPLPYSPVLLHDFGLASRHVAIPVFPQTVQILKVLAGLESMMSASRWEPEKGAYVYVARRDGDGLRRYELPAMYAFHVVNCFEDQDTLVLDLAASATGEVLGAIGKVRTAGTHGLPPAHPTRVRLYADGRSEIERLSEAAVEFPRIDPRRQGLAHRYSYFVAGRGDGDAFASVARLEPATGTLVCWLAPEGHQVGEPVPVSKGTDEAVWLLSVVYDPAIHRSRVVVLDGEALEAGPVAEIHLPNHLPLGFHGNFSRG